MERFSNGAILKWSNSQMERFSNGAILKWSDSQMEQFSNGAIWGRHHQLDDSLVGQLTRPVPSSTIQYCSKLTQYHQVPTSTALDTDLLPPSTNQWCPILTQNHQGLVKGDGAIWANACKNGYFCHNMSFLDHQEFLGGRGLILTKSDHNDKI